MNIETLKEDLAAEHARHKAEMERALEKLVALARLVDAEQALRELEESPS